MSSVKRKKILMMDLGLQVELGVRLARDGAVVKYFCSWNQGGFPKSDQALIGYGLEGIEREKEFFKFVDWADLIVFPDTYCEDIVESLKSKGYRVFGAGRSEVLENDRWKMRQIQKTIGLPVQKTWRIKGIQKLIDFLKVNKNVFVKINSFRGDIESFHHSEYDTTQAQFLGELLVNAGAKATELEFVVEASIEGLEPGYDGFVVNGEYPNYAMWGFEKKGTGYIGRTDKYEDIPKPIKLVNDKLKPVFKKLGGITFFSTEIIVTKEHKGYLIDPCVRCPMPVPTALHLEMWENLSDFIWEASGGNLIDLKPKAKYGAGYAFDSPWAEKHWTEIQFPKEYRQWIKLRRACRIDGKYYALPGFDSLGAIVSLGSTIDEALGKVEKIAHEVKVKELTLSLSDLKELKEQVVRDAKQYNLNF